MRRLLMLPLVVFSFVRPAVGQAVALPPVVKAGFEAYQAKGKEAAVDAWVSGSALAQDPTVRPSLVQAMGHVENLFGAFAGYDVLKVVAFGPHASRTYAVFVYQRGPAFAYFDAFQAPGGTTLTAFQFHTKAHEILPPQWFAQ
jgi:hypothetical protein